MYYRRLRDLREDMDMTQREIAGLLHVAQNTYRRYEIGQAQIPSDCVILLAEFYHTSADYILGRTDNPLPPGQRQGGRKA